MNPDTDELYPLLLEMCPNAKRSEIFFALNMLEHSNPLIVAQTAWTIYEGAIESGRYTRRELCELRSALDLE